jgi:hypothetical protein
MRVLTDAPSTVDAGVKTREHFIGTILEIELRCQLLPNENKKSSADAEVESWLSEIKDVYGTDHAEDFKVEEPFLKQFLLKLKEETEENGRLSICKLEHPFKRGVPQ